MHIHNQKFTYFEFPITAIRTLYRYTGAKKWTSGEIKYDIQLTYQIKLNNVECTRGEWGSCKYSEDTRYCEHENDVFLGCHGDFVIHYVSIKPLTTM